MVIITDKKKIEEALSRSVSMVYPTKAVVEKELLSGRQLRIYMGIDPTADYVHLGHSTNYLLLERLHTLGHKIIVLVGDFTAMIGDPSDKTAERSRLTKEQVMENLATFKEQIGKILDFENKNNPIEFKFNSEWLSKLDFEQLTDLASSFTVQQMLERDMFEKRLKENKPLYVHEFFYPLMQGYDSVALEADLEIGGTDQTFNMLTGRTLVKRYQDREKFVISTTLLVNSATGEKMMSKSLGTGIALNESPKNMFGKIMALADGCVNQVFVDCTRLTLEEIAEKELRLKSGENPKNIKMDLAHEIVQMYFDKKVADEAEEDWSRTFSKGELPDEILEIKAEAGEILSDVLVRAAVIKSKSEWRRLVEEGAVSMAGEEKITDPYYKITQTETFKIGKKRFLKIII